MIESDSTSGPLGSSGLVMVGSSTGGVEALSILIRTLSPVFLAPLVLGQPFTPIYPARLVAMLQRRTPLPVVAVPSHTALEPGKIDVVPSRYHAAIKDAYRDVRGNHEGRSRPSIDLFLSSAVQVRIPGCVPCSLWC